VNQGLVGLGGQRLGKLPTSVKKEDLLAPDANSAVQSFDHRGSRLARPRATAAPILVESSGSRSFRSGSRAAAGSSPTGRAPCQMVANVSLRGGSSKATASAPLERLASPAMPAAS
jgi:hypothetical protein